MHFLPSIGVLYHYLLINLVLWWFFHVFVFAASLLFPERSRIIKKKGLHKYISIFVILLCKQESEIYTISCVVIIILVILAGLLSPALTGNAVAFSSRAHGYRLQRLPPGLPTASNILWFYSIIFLYCIFLAGGMCVLVISVWILLKHSLSNKVSAQNMKWNNSISSGHSLYHQVTHC